MRELIKILQGYQLDALHNGATCSLETTCLDSSVTEVKVKVYYSNVIGSDFIDNRTFTATFGSGDEKQSNDAKLKALNQFLYSISK